MGFQNEKDHPEVAPSQFEINYSYAEVVAAADQIQLYKLICRQVATNMGFTARFLPKPVVGVNGSGMHTNVSISKDGKNLFWDPKGEEKISKFGWEFVDRILTHGNDICLLLNASVNAYRRLDPHFEAPNQIKASAVDRGSMVRIPIGNETQHARGSSLGRPGCESVHGAVLGLQDRPRRRDLRRSRTCARRSAICRTTSTTRMENFRKAEWTTKLLGEDVKGRYADLKQASADRCPRLLGTFVKAPEVQYHHEVYNQFLWNHVLDAVKQIRDGVHRKRAFGCNFSATARGPRHRSEHVTSTSMDNRRPVHRSFRGGLYVRQSIVMSSAGVTPGWQPSRSRRLIRTAISDQPFVMEYYYKVKWGHADEFLHAVQEESSSVAAERNSDGAHAPRDAATTSTTTPRKTGRMGLSGDHRLQECRRRERELR